MNLHPDHSKNLRKRTLLITADIGPRQLAEIFGVKVGTVFSWLSRGVDLPAYVKIAGTARWRPEVVQQWIEKKEKEKRRKNFQE
jgi:predicted DNA-binding transcriptional regulator AlpA